MINIGDIVEYIDPDQGGVRMLSGLVKKHDLFVVKHVDSYIYRGESRIKLIGVNVIGYKYNPYYIYNYRFKLIAKKTDFGYVFVI
jgi:hypothetical protein